MVREIQKKIYSTKILEWFGVLTAIVYSLLVASNTGYEALGFSLLLISAISIGFGGFFVDIMGFCCFNFSMLLQV